MLFSYAALQMNILARGYLAYDLSGPLALGYVSLARGLPMFVFSALGGVVADRVEKRKLLIYTQSGLAGLALVNAVLVAAGVIEVWQLAVLASLEGVVAAFNLPPRQAILPELVGRDQLTNALAINNAGMNLNRIFGPALAGILIGVPFFGLSGVFFLITVFYTVIVFTLFRLPVTPVAARAIKTGVITDIRAGWQHVFSRPLLLMLLLMAFILVLLGMPYQQFLPVFAREVVHVGASGLGLMAAASGSGALMGSLAVAYLADYPRKALLQLGTGIGFGLAIVGFALSSSFALSLVFLLLVGMTGNSYLALNNTMIMMETSREFHGRVMSVYMVTWSLMPLSTMPLSIMIDSIGPSPTIAMAGAAIALLVACIALLRPEFRRTEIRATA